MGEGRKQLHFQTLFNNKMKMRYFIGGKEVEGMGDVVEIMAKPLAIMLKLPCLDENGKLKPTSPCAGRKKLMNAAFPFKPRPKKFP